MKTSVIFVGEGIASVTGTANIMGVRTRSALMMERTITFQFKANDENKNVAFFLIQVPRPQEFHPWVPWISVQGLCFGEKELMAATVEPHPTEATPVLGVLMQGGGEV